MGSHPSVISSSRIHIPEASSGIMINKRQRLPAGPSFILGWRKTLKENVCSDWILSLSMLFFTFNLYHQRCPFAPPISLSIPRPPSIFHLRFPSSSPLYKSPRTSVPCVLFAFGHLNQRFIAADVDGQPGRSLKPHAAKDRYRSARAKQSQWKKDILKARMTAIC